MHGFLVIGFTADAANLTNIPLKRGAPRRHGLPHEDNPIEHLQKRLKGSLVDWLTASEKMEQTGMVMMTESSGDELQACLELDVDADKRRLTCEAKLGGLETTSVELNCWITDQKDGLTPGLWSSTKDGGVDVRITRDPSSEDPAIKYVRIRSRNVRMARIVLLSFLDGSTKVKVPWVV